MPKRSRPTYSRLCRHAVALLGKQIRLGRKQRKMTAQELAQRAGISRGLLQRIEKGAMGSQIGAVFEVATIAGVRLFDADAVSLAGRIRQADERLALLPARIQPNKNVVDDDF